jgi:threonine dehydrogenase-like Zn-dependent dehydrogenase
MRALFYPAWQTLEVKELPMPIPAEGEALLRVTNCGICGSELETFRALSARRTPPLVMGHEFCGQIESVGDSMPTQWLKKRVIAHSVIHCGACPACERGDTNLCSERRLFGMHRPGGFAEFVTVPERVLIPWPEGLPGESAVFTEPLANGINAVRLFRRGGRVLVIGAGPVGLMCVLAASRLHGAEPIVVDLVPERLAAARAMGARHTVDANKGELRDDTFWRSQGGKADYVIDAVGSARTKSLSLEVAAPGGTVVWVGLQNDQVQIDSYPLILNQISLVGSYAGTMADLREAAKLLASSQIDLSWATIYPLAQGDLGFQEMLAGHSKNIKGILDTR